MRWSANNKATLSLRTFNCFWRIAPDHPVFRAVLRAKIALDRAQDIGVVIHA